jgi:glycosyltransferase involved in cell wall biosynthesis
MFFTLVTCPPSIRKYTAGIEPDMGTRPTAIRHIDQNDYHRWIREVESPQVRNFVDRFCNEAFDEGWPQLAIVMPTYNTPQALLHQALQSLLNQAYGHWQLWVVDDASESREVKETLRNYATADQRIRVIYREENGGISEASNNALEKADADFIAFMDHDDTLPPHALLTVAHSLREHPDTQILYSDSDELSAEGVRCNPYFKQDWNYELFLGQNFLNHLTVYAAKLLHELGGLRSEFDGSQDYDLALRAIERTACHQILHVPEILYHWRHLPSSFARSNLALAAKRARSAVTEHLQRTGCEAEVVPAPSALIYNRVIWRASRRLKTALILYGDSLDEIEADLKSLSSRIAENISIHPLVFTDGASAGSALNELIERLDADIVCAFPGTFEPDTENWLALLQAYLQRPSIAALSPKVIDASDSILGGPLRTGLHHPCGAGLLGPAFEGEPGTDKGYFSQLALDQQVCTAGLAGLTFLRSVFNEIGGFDAQLNDPVLLGADFTLRMGELGYQTLWTPFVTFRAASQRRTVFTPEPPLREKDSRRFRDNWADKIVRELNPNLSDQGALP